MKREDIEKLAKLSRLSLRDDEKEGFVKDLDAILGYVSEINEAVAALPEKKAGELRNVMREDGEPHEPGMHTEAVLGEAPATQDGYIKVRQVFE